MPGTLKKEFQTKPLVPPLFYQVWLHTQKQVYQKVHQNQWTSIKERSVPSCDLLPNCCITWQPHTHCDSFASPGNVYGVLDSACPLLGWHSDFLHASNCCCFQSPFPRSGLCSYSIWTRVSILKKTANQTQLGWWDTCPKTKPAFEGMLI